VKVFFLVLLIVKSPSGIEYLKVPFAYSIIPITCEEQFQKVAKWIKNKNYTEGSGKIFGYYTYKNKIIGGHFCIDEHGNYYNGYEEKLNWELGH
tara:strand:+ start:303 stop:584 length:282 start_codon:yes stop_codon:yes gene_type:complete